MDSNDNRPAPDFRGFAARIHKNDKTGQAQSGQKTLRAMINHDWVRYETAGTALIRWCKRCGTLVHEVRGLPGTLIRAFVPGGPYDTANIPTECRMKHDEDTLFFGVHDEAYAVVRFESPDTDGIDYQVFETEEEAREYIEQNETKAVLVKVKPCGGGDHEMKLEGVT